MDDIIPEDQWGPWEICDFCGITSRYVQVVNLPGGKIARRIGPEIDRDSYDEVEEVKAFALVYDRAKRLGLIRGR